MRLNQAIPDNSYWRVSALVNFFKNKKEIKEKVNRIKGNGQIVSFLTNVSDETTTVVNLEVRPLSEVLPCNSLICYNKLQV